MSQYTYLPNIPCKPTTNCQGWDYVYKQVNGSVIGLTTSGVTEATYLVHAIIDANGIALPNKVGEDRLQVSLSPQKSNLVDSNAYGMYPAESRTPNKLLFDSL